MSKKGGPEDYCVRNIFEERKVKLGMLEERADENDYWSSCHFFVNGVWDDRIETLTAKQASWVEKIADDMEEWRIKAKKNPDAYDNVRV